MDGDYQKYSVEPGSYTRKHFFGKYPELLELVNHLTDEQIRKLLRGGHDTRKVYAAYKAAMEHKGQPTVILAKTVKGYGLGEARRRQEHHAPAEENEREGAARIPRALQHPRSATTSLPKRRSTVRRRTARKRNICSNARKALGGFLPARIVNASRRSTCRSCDCFAEFFKGSARGAFDDDGVCAAAEHFAAAQGV